MKEFLLPLFLLGAVNCQGRTSEKSTELELKLILGEPVTCYKIYPDSGYLCRTEVKKNYYCPDSGKIACFYTDRLVLLDVPLENPKPTPSK